MRPWPGVGWVGVGEAGGLQTYSELCRIGGPGFCWRLVAHCFGEKGF